MPWESREGVRHTPPAEPMTNDQAARVSVLLDAVNDVLAALGVVDQEPGALLDVADTCIAARLAAAAADRPTATKAWAAMTQLVLAAIEDLPEPGATR